MSETAYSLADDSAELTHAYGSNVHILSDRWALSLLARLGHPDTQTVELQTLIESGYRRLLQAMSVHLPSLLTTVPTRMAALTPQGHFHGAIVDPTHEVVIADVARAGILPSHVLQRELLLILDNDKVRVDHVYMQRVVNEETGAVVGTDLAGSKIAGPVDGRTLIIPDPMGATGGSICHVVDHYKRTIGTPAQIIVAHLMVTPEYIKRVTTEHPEVIIYALRLDRGGSADEVLRTVPGTRWEEEVGLTDIHYIIPGAGGVGELIYNAFV